jgi:hypothetical protein
MAIPPDPIDDVLFDAKLVVVGEVVAVVAEGSPPARIEAEPGVKDVGNKAPWQRVQVRIDQALLGTAPIGSVVEVLKPEAGYLLSVGIKGDFLLGAAVDGVAPLLGRYGPDSYRHDVVVAALAKRG